MNHQHIADSGGATTTASNDNRKRPRSSCIQNMRAIKNRRTDGVLLTLSAIMALNSFLSLTHFAPLHLVVDVISSRRCAHPRILYSSNEAWGDDDYFEKMINKTALEEQRKMLTIVSKTLVGVGGSVEEHTSNNFLTMARQEDMPTVRVKLHRELQYGPMSEFEPEHCCRRYDHPHYEDVGEHCELIAPEWQTAHRPTCNSIHEISIDDGANGLYGSTDDKRKWEADALSLWLASGDYRDVWAWGETDGSPRVLKTLVWKHQQTRPKILRMFRDEAAAMDHLHQSPYVATVLGVCGVSQVQNFSAQGGFKRPARKGKFTSLEKLKVSTQVARAVSDVHDFNKENGGKATMAVADVSSGQFVYNEYTKTFCLQDMNLLMMLKKDGKTGDTCKFRSAPSAGMVRSPEEYWETDHTELVDIWALGNVIHFLMRGDYAFCDQDISESSIKRSVKKGDEPPSFREIEKSGDEIEKSILQIIKKTRRINPYKRPTAWEVREYLEDLLVKFTGSTDVFVDMEEVNERHSN